MISESKANYHWLISKKDDLLWIIGSSGVGLFLLGLYFFLNDGLPYLSDIKISEAAIVGIIFLFWTFFFDSTHFFATYSRTYFDRDYHKDNYLLLYSSLLVFSFGPLLLITPLFMAEKEFQKSFTQAIFTLIIFGSILWGYYHIVRQHWGMVALYQKKNKEKNITQYRLDAALLAVGCIWPFVFYLNENILTIPRLLSVRETFQETDFIHYLLYLSGLTMLAGVFCKRIALLEVLGKLFLYSGFVLLVVLVWVYFGIGGSLESHLNIAELLVRGLFVCILLVYVGYYLFFNKDWNIPKFLLIISVLIIHNLVLLSVVNFLLISACLTIFHNIQYHRIVRYFNVNHYQKAEQGLAVVLTRKLLYFMVFALVFSAVVIALRGSVLLTNSGLVKMILITSIINGISLHHYYLDGVIWRVSKSNTLSASLKV